MLNTEYESAENQIIFVRQWWICCAFHLFDCL